MNGNEWEREVRVMAPVMMTGKTRPLLRTNSFSKAKETTDQADDSLPLRYTCRFWTRLAHLSSHQPLNLHFIIDYLIGLFECHSFPRRLFLAHQVA